MEVFSKRSRISSGQEAGIQPLAVVTPSRLQTLFAGRLNEICVRFDDWTLPFKLVGRLGSVPPDIWRRHEPLPLLDLQDEGEIGLEVFPALVAESGVQAGDSVYVTGFMRARLVRGQVVARFEVLSLTPHEGMERPEVPSVADEDDTDIALLSMLRDYPPGRHIFPMKSDMSLLLVGLGTTEERMALLTDSLGGVWHKRSIRSLFLAENDGMGLRHAMLHGKEDVIVLLAGEAGCAALEAPDMLVPLAICQAYRVLILDRDDYADSKDGMGVIAAYLADYSLSSPVEAGRYLRQEAGKRLQELEEKRACQEELSALRDSLAYFANLPPTVPRYSMMRAVLLGMVLGIFLLVLGGFGVALLKHFLGS